MSTVNGIPICDGWCARTVAEPITHIDEKGFTYCKDCGPRRRGVYIRCRKLAAWERRFIYGGKPIPSYQRGPMPKDGVA